MVHSIDVIIKNKIARANDVAIVCENNDYVINFTFDEEWDEYNTKTARFVYGDHYTDVIFTGNQCEIPVLKDINLVSVGVFAGDLHTTTPAVIRCLKSILSKDGSPQEPTPDVYAQIMEQLNKQGSVSWLAEQVEQLNGKVNELQKTKQDLLAISDSYDPTENKVATIASITTRIAALKAEIDEMISSLTITLNILIGGDANKSVREITQEEIAAQLANGGESFDSLKEIAEWLKDHPEDVGEMNAKINEAVATANDAKETADAIMGIANRSLDLATIAFNHASTSKENSEIAKQNATNALEIVQSEVERAKAAEENLSQTKQDNLSFDGTYNAESNKAATVETVTGGVSTHNVSATAHNDIRLLIKTLTDRLNALADSDDETLDQMSEIVAYIKANKDLIDSVTTSKVNVADIINDLETNAEAKPLSAAQGVVLKGLIDALSKDKLNASDLPSAINSAVTEANSYTDRQIEAIPEVDTSDFVSKSATNEQVVESPLKINHFSIGHNRIIHNPYGDEIDTYMRLSADEMLLHFRNYDDFVTYGLHNIKFANSVDGWEEHTLSFPEKSGTLALDEDKQDTLVNGKNIATINNTSLLAGGNIAVQPTLVSGTNIKTINSTSLLGSGNIAVQPTLYQQALTLKDSTGTIIAFATVITSTRVNNLNSLVTLLSSSNVSYFGVGGYVLQGASLIGIMHSIGYSSATGVVMRYYPISGTSGLQSKAVATASSNYSAIIP